MNHMYMDHGYTCFIRWEVVNRYRWEVHQSGKLLGYGWNRGEIEAEHSAHDFVVERIQRERLKLVK